MSTDESGHLEFRGTDLRECEQFITAVTKHARAHGKLQDDQWIADFVSTCMTGDALIWWSLLDEGTRGSWKLLKEAMITTFRPLFYGKSGAEAEDFVSQVRKRALHARRVNDQRWAAEFASGCFLGSALRWYMSLESGVRDDWVELQQAIFAQYGPEFEESSLIIPTPAPAATALAASATSGLFTVATAPVAINGRRRGRIKVIMKGDPKIHYLSKSLEIGGHPGRVRITTSIAEALEVEYEFVSSSDGPQSLFIPNNQLPGFDVLGMKSYFPEITGDDRFGVSAAAASLKFGSRIPGLVTPWTSPNESLEDLSVRNESKVNIYFGNKRIRGAIGVLFKPVQRTLGGHDPSTPAPAEVAFFYPLDNAVDVESLSKELELDAFRLKKDWFAFNGGTVTTEAESGSKKHRRPLFFDIAFNYVESPMKRINERAGKAVTERAEKPTAAPKAKVDKEDEDEKQDEEEEGRRSPVVSKTAAGGGITGFFGWLVGQAVMKFRLNFVY